MERPKSNCVALLEELFTLLSCSIYLFIFYFCAKILNYNIKPA